jgi:hypothetical protein
MRSATALTALSVLLVAGPARGQDYDGYFSSLFLLMPDADASEGRQTVAELRSRLLVEGLFNPSDRVHLRLGAYVDTLAGRRESAGADGAAAAAVLRPSDLFVEWRRDKFDLRAGMSRIAWGRLDEFQPTDVVNPIDLSRFLLEGRSEARLPVALLRARAFLPRGGTLEGILVPVFRGGIFDELEEETSPFRLSPNGLRDRREPAVSAKNLQGGVRATSTIGRVDWGVSAWRGFESFPTFTLVAVSPEPLALVIPTFLETFPRFTMLGADFETVSGPWGLRGEFGFFGGASPRSFEGGIGADRRAGSYRVALNAVVSRADDTDVTLVGWAERTFARETRSARVLAVYDPADETAFVRGIGAVSLRDSVWLEGSAGWFTGQAPSTAASGVDVLSLLSRRDFLYARLKVHF